MLRYRRKRLWTMVYIHVSCQVGESVRACDFITPGSSGQLLGRKEGVQVLLEMRFFLTLCDSFTNIHPKSAHSPLLEHVVTYDLSIAVSKRITGWSLLADANGRLSGEVVGIFEFDEVANVFVR